jgi:uncharacterized glyoxalase superfamily protein PhnB
MNSNFPAAVPEIPVNDLAKAVQYYETKLGFGVDWSDEQLGLAGISRGKCRIFLADLDFRKGYGNVGSTLIWLNLNSKEEVDELYEEWSGNGVNTASSPESKPWGLHEFTASDLDGNLFRVFYDFATPERESKQ